MSHEISMLRHFCENRKAEETHGGYIDMLSNMERETKLLFNLVHTYYEEFDRDSITRDDLIDFYMLKYPKSRDQEMHLDLINQVYLRDYNEEMSEKLMDRILERHKAAQILNKLLPVIEGDTYEVLDSIGTDVDDYVNLLHNPPEHLSIPVPVTTSIDELIEREILDEGWSWHLPVVTQTIGGVRRKTLGLIYAYVDAGKTSFAMASCAHLATQIPDGDVIAYCGNEEAGDRLRLRLLSTMLHWNRSDVAEDKEKAKELAGPLGWDKVLIFEGVTAGEQIEKILKEYKPAIMYVDQSTDVDVRLSRKREGVDYLKALFKWYRTVSTEHDVAIIGVAQGVGEAENTKYLKLSDVLGSRSAIQGSLDWAIGIGKQIDDPVSENQRYINMPKNKLLDGDKDKFACMFNHYNNTWRAI